MPVPTINLSALSSNPINAFASSPLSMMMPASPDAEPVVPVPSSNSLSETVVFVVLTVVVVPDTVRLPCKTRLPDISASPFISNEPPSNSPLIAMSLGKPIVTVPALSATVTSFEVPAKVRVPPNATGLVFDPSDTVILEFANLEFGIAPASILFSTEVA